MESRVGLPCLALLALLVLTGGLAYAVGRAQGERVGAQRMNAGLVKMQGELRAHIDRTSAAEGPDDDPAGRAPAGRPGSVAAAAAAPAGHAEWQQ